MKLLELGRIRHRARHECVKINVWDSGEMPKKGREKGWMWLWCVSNNPGSFPSLPPTAPRTGISFPARLFPFEGVFFFFPAGMRMGKPVTSLSSSLCPVNDFLEVWAGRESRKLGNSLPAFATSALLERDKA